LEEELNSKSIEDFYFPESSLLSIEFDPLLDPLRDDPRFEEMKNKVKSTWLQDENGNIFSGDANFDNLVLDITLKFRRILGVRNSQ
jgi:hypothetical protein